MRSYTSIKTFELQINNSNTKKNKLIKAVSLGRAKISIRYLAHLLENGKIGYFNLKKISLIFGLINGIVLL